MLRSGHLLLLLLLPFAVASLLYPDEPHLSDVRQLTSAGVHSRSAFSSQNDWITFQAAGTAAYGTSCDQIYRLRLETPAPAARLSNGIGGVSNAVFSPNSSDAYYAGNFHKVSIDRSRPTMDSCPVRKCDSAEARTNPELGKLCNATVTWDLFPDFDVFKINAFANILGQLTSNDVYDGELAISPDSSKIVFTSARSGDPELWIANADGTNLRQLTNETGFEGGASFSADGSSLVFHASRPSSADELKQYRDLLQYNLVSVSNLEIYTINLDGSSPTRVTAFGGTNWYPVFAPEGQIVFSSNFNGLSDFSEFHLFKTQHGSYEQISSKQSKYDAYPSFSSDGKKLIWSSSRSGSGNNLFSANWVATATNSLEDDNKHDYAQTEPAKRWQDLETAPYDNIVHFDGEKHLKNVKQLTFGGQNAEGYFSFDDSRLTIQATGGDYYGTQCDQIYQIDLNHDPRMQTLPRISTGLGGTTCSYYFKENDNHFSLYAGSFWNVTMHPEAPTKNCPPKRCANKENITDPVLKNLCNTQYTWDIYPDYDIFKVNQYGNVVQQLTNSPGYDAEGVLSPDGKLIAFTSIRSGDLELWIMNSDGTNARQITKTLGYDGGSFFSPDGKRLIFRASRPKTDEEIKIYKQLLSYDLVAPTAMELFVVDIDGSNMRQITHLGGANWAPYYLNDNKRVVFSSDFNQTQANFGAFDLYLIRDDGTGLERVTYDEGMFDSFPMMNYEGTKLVWGSSRNGSMYELNLFIADWVDPDPQSSAATITNANISTTTTTTTISSATKAARCVYYFASVLILLAYVVIHVGA